MLININIKINLLKVKAEKTSAFILYFVIVVNHIYALGKNTVILVPISFLLKTLKYPL